MLQEPTLQTEDEGTSTSTNKLLLKLPHRERFIQAVACWAGKGLFRPWPVGRRNGKGGKVVEGLDFEEVCFP
jgi:hypothetical protein